MKKYIKSNNVEPVLAAEGENILDDLISQNEADFEFILTGAAKMARDGAEADAVVIMQNLSDTLQQVINTIADGVSDDGGSDVE